MNVSLRAWIVLIVVALLVAALAVARWRAARSSSWFQPAGSGQPHDELTEEDVTWVFQFEQIGPTYHYDPVAYVQRSPDLEEEVGWPEHPSGVLRFRTNNLGFRADEPTLTVKRGLRILVAGDSQIAGPLYNTETVAHRLQTRLRAEPGRETLEVLNVAVPYTGPYCYAGALRKHLGLAPDVFVAVFYTGNDLWDDLRVRLCLDGLRPQWGDADYRGRVTAATERAPSPMWQGQNQAVRWKHRPAEAELALATAIDSFRRMQALCTERGIEFLAVVLPTKMDVEPEDDGETQEAVRELLGLSVEEAGINRTLGLRFAQAMRDEGIHCLDPCEEMRRAPHPLYWRTDYHLAPAGHALLAELLERELRGRL